MLVWSIGVCESYVVHYLDGARYLVYHLRCYKQLHGDKHYLIAGKRR